VLRATTTLLNAVGLHEVSAARYLQAAWHHGHVIGRCAAAQNWMHLDALGGTSD